ncbi:hypothetical protein GQ43DRAFT_442164 [Delitschia confertaspora ATCC 74209]|uniref:Uncharacterized protein n=1 Tax=Delitschia confertaspora ATCC 74209 TaxID=1513339 RepID=A0A9P4JI10_9PLEO|nr:hypothetical protein GQ43DRAFT_442164 [Delitschia confertaspora ATCC 74209]
MVDQFFNNAGSTFESHEITADQIRTVKACIDGTISPTEAAKQLTAYLEASSKPVELQQRINGLWTLLNHTAVALPSAQPTIISILRTIRTFPKATVPTGEDEDAFDFDDGDYWKELTDWASDWADQFNYYAAQFSIDPSKNSEEKAQRKKDWISACAYTARLSVCGDEALSSYGEGLNRATFTIIDVLEHDLGDKENEELEAAAQLFIYAAPELYRRCKENQSEGINKQSGLWHGKNGFAEARWKFWMERWEAMTEKDSFSKDARKIAREALESMKKICT